MEISYWKDEHAHVAMCVLAIVVLFVFFSPRVRYDGIRYVAPARSLLVDGDLNTYNEDSFYTRPGWNSVVRRQVRGDLRQMVKYENAPDYTPNGYRHVVFPIGNTMAWLPVMTLTHLFMQVSLGMFGSFAADGFSIPYILALGWFSFAVGILACIIAYRVLRLWYSPGVSWLALMFGFCAGNIIPFLAIDVTFSHSLDFLYVNIILLLSAIIMYSYGEEYETGTLRGVHALLGLACGFAVITRYQDVTLLLLPAVIYFSQLVTRNPKNHEFSLKQPLVFTVCFLAVVAIQMVYWKILYGQFFISGDMMGTGGLASFRPSHPQIMAMFFSKFHGLFSWSPWLLPVSITAFLFVRRNKLFGITFLVIMLLQIYYNSARTEWWNLGFSVRRFSGWTVFFMIGAAELLMLCKNKNLLSLVKFLGGLAIFWNWIFIINFFLGTTPGGIFPDLVKDVGPYGEVAYGFIVPSFQQLLQGCIAVWKWFTDYSWAWYVIHWFKSDLKLIAMGVLVCQIVFALLLRQFILRSYPVTLEDTRRPVLIICVYLVLFLGVIGCSHGLAKNKNLYWFDARSNELKLQSVRVNNMTGFTGVNQFAKIPPNGLTIPLKLSQGERVDMVIGAFGLAESVNCRELIRSSLTGEQIGAVQLMPVEEECEALVKPWGDVPYLKRYYRIRYDLSEIPEEKQEESTATGLQLRIRPGTPDGAITFAGMMY